MDFAKLIHDKKKVLDAWVKMPDGQVITRKACKIHVPCRFTEHDLAYVGVDTQVVGLFSVIVDEVYYAVVMLNAIIQLNPVSTDKVKINGVDYYEFGFNKGQVVILSCKTVKDDTIPYKLYDEVISKAKVPAYMSYDMLGSIFDTAKKYAGANVGGQSEVIEMLASVITRWSGDLTKYFRQVIKKPSDVLTQPKTYAAMRNVAISATNTTAKLLGSHFDAGVASALLHPSERVERMEELLRR
jgi:hypothetical protein